MARLNWQRPGNTAPRTAGVLCIESDDGWLGDWTHWLPTIIDEYRKRSKFFPPPPFTPDVNSGVIGRPNRMKPEHLQRIEAIGGEIISHGRWHVRLGGMKTTTALDPGATEITVDESPGEQGVEEGLPRTFEIDGGGNKETFTAANIVGKTIVAADPLTYGYPQGSTVRLSESSTVNDILKGCLDDLSKWGVGAPHHVYTWHSHDEVARERVAQVMESARGRIGIETGEDVDFYQLRARLITNLDEEKIDEDLDAIIASDGAMIVYGHGETTSDVLDILRLLVGKALDKGVRIVTRSELVAHLKAKETA